MENIKDIVKKLSALQIVIVLILGGLGYLAYTYISKEEPVVEEPSVQKTVGDINQGGDQTTSNGNNDSSNSISF